MTPIVYKTAANTSPSSATTAAGSKTFGGLDSFDALTIVAELQGATGGTLDVYLQTSFDGGTTWYDYVHFAQLAAAAAAVTYSITPALSNSIATIGKNTSPVLTAGTCAGGRWGPLMRVLFVAGASTSAGAVQTITLIGSSSASGR